MSSRLLGECYRFIHKQTNSGSTTRRFEEGGPADLQMVTTDSPRKGDIIKFPRRFYNHYGIYIGDGMIIHFKSGSRTHRNFRPVIRKDTLDYVRKNGRAKVDNFLDEKRDAYPCEDIVKTAESLLGPRDYHFLRDNCEHCEHCRYRKAVSKQAERLMPLKRFSPVYLGNA